MIGRVIMAALTHAVVRRNTMNSAYVRKMVFINHLGTRQTMALKKQSSIDQLKGRCPPNVLSDFRLSEPPVVSIPITENFPRKSDPIPVFPIFFPILCPSMVTVLVDFKRK
jgi:hypothetical protein